MKDNIHIQTYTYVNKNAISPYLTLSLSLPLYIYFSVCVSVYIRKKKEKWRWLKEFIKRKGVRCVQDLKKNLKEEEWEAILCCYGLQWEAMASAIFDSIAYEHVFRMNKMTYTSKILFLFKEAFELKKQDRSLTPCMEWLEVKKCFGTYDINAPTR